MVYRCECKSRPVPIVKLSYRVDWQKLTFEISGTIPSPYRDKVHTALRNCMGDCKFDGTGKLAIFFKFDGSWDFEDVDRRVQLHSERMGKRTGLVFVIRKL